MKVKHTTTLMCHCPVNDARDVYEVTIEIDRLVMVEELCRVLENYTSLTMTQEEATEKLAKQLDAKVTTRGHHGAVFTEVVCE